jgi:hypothetical protein
MIPYPNPPYDNLTTILNTARVYANDFLSSLISTSGKLLDNTDAFSQQIVNSGWRKMQETLANWGHTKFKQEVIITGIPPINPTVASDPATQIYLNWGGFFDGLVFYPAPPGTWFLPSDLSQPLKCWQRLTGYNQPFGEPIGYALDGLPTYQKGINLTCWEWRNETLYSPGALQACDLRILYCNYLPDFVDVSATSRWYQQQVPLVRCQEPLAWYIVWALASARGQGNADALPLIAEMLICAENAAKLLYNKDVRMKQRTDTRRKSRSGRLERGSSGYGWGWNGGY